MPLFRIALLQLFLTCSLFAQTVRWEPDGGSLALNRSSEIQLVFEDCEPTEEPRVPAVSGLELQRTTQMENTTIANGVRKHSLIFGYNARPTTQTPLAIPEFTVETDRGRMQVKAVRFDVTQSTAGNGKIPLDSVAQARFQVPRDVWAGEVFDLGYRISIVRRYFAQFASNLNWTPAPLITEDWSKPVLQEALRSGDKQIVLSMDTRAIAPIPGTIEMTAGNQLVNIVTGASSFGFLSSPNLEQFAINTDRPQLNVKPLPGGAPASFNGAVGEFTLASKAVPQNAQVGEPVTWTVSVEGLGNWPSIDALPSRDVAKSFRVVQSQPKRTSKAGTIFEAKLEEDVVLIPTIPGTYTLGPIAWTYFDPRSGQYRTVQSEPHTLTITAATVQPAPTAGLSSPTAAPKTAPGMPSPVPGDTVSGASVAAPLGVIPLRLITWSPALALLLFWLGLSHQRARAGDPARTRREARTHALNTLAGWNENLSHEQKVRIVQDWQRDSATIWELDRAVPVAKQFANDAQWQQLWRESEAFLYRRESGLPADWAARARQALERHPIPGFKLSSILLGKHLLPLIAVAACLMPNEGRSAPLDEYQKGNIAAAEAGWRTELETQPRNWALHHNLSLALAQQALWSEATAHAAIAFVQAPQEQATRRQLTLCLSRADFTPQGFPGLLESGLAPELATRFSPRSWQNLLILAAVFLALAIALRLYVAFRHGSRRYRWSANGGIVLAIAAVALASFGLDRWGTLRDRHAVLIWENTTLHSIPTAADTAQQTSTLAAGTVAIAERTFLSWTRLRFPDGQTGWIRTNEAMSFWSPQK